MANVLKLTLGDRIRRRRSERALTLRGVSRLVGIAPSYLSDIENDRRIPAETVLKRLANVLDTDFDALMAIAGRLGDRTEQYIRHVPAAGALFRSVSEGKLDDADLARLQTLVEELNLQKSRAEGGRGRRHA